MAKISLKSIKIEAEKEIKSVSDLKTLNDIYKKYLGKKGKVTQIFRSLKDLPEKERKNIGELTNQIKQVIKKSIERKRKKFQIPSFHPSDDQPQTGKFQEDWIDITAPGKRLRVGHLHPMTLVKRKVEEIFQGLGFSVVEGPEIENEWYNFDALNIPQDHPARDLWDTFYLKDGLLLRTHTSPVQIKFMEKNNPPFRIIAPGRVYRHEATDTSHEFELYQVEGLMVGKDISVANFKAIIQYFLREFFEKPVKIRLRPSYFPFVEPGFEIDMSCLICRGKGCSTCSQTGWIEILGAGMVHPNVLKNSGLNPKNWQGFAFGIGMDRLTMMKYKIDDIRLFHSGDLRFLEQF